VTWIKICGTTSAEDAAIAVEAGVDALGFIFAPSKRRIEPSLAREIAATVPASVARVGVFVNEPVERVCEIAATVGLTMVQLHGDEDVAYIQRLRSTEMREILGFSVFKAIAVRDGFEQHVVEFLMANRIEGVLFDSPPAAGSPFRGGTGHSFDWDVLRSVLPRMGGRVPAVISGGLSPENVSRAVRQLRPWGVDVCSGVESEPGRKHPEKVISFVRAVRSAGGVS
jgi:phosphoribosylanthranilate isomerase